MEDVSYCGQYWGIAVTIKSTIFRSATVVCRNSGGSRSGPATLTVTASRGLDRYHRVTLNGKELETHFVSTTELQAVVPPQAIKEGGPYTVEVIRRR